MEIPENFKQIVTDMTGDLSKTFPEYSQILHKWTDNQSLTFSDEIKKLFEYSLSVYPERFFDIIYQNETIFDNDDINTCFLPGIDFSILFKSNGISISNRKIMWNYLKLVLLTIVSTIKDKSSFGNANNLFDGVDEKELFSKLSETMESMNDFFQNVEENMEGPPTSFEIPKVDDVFGHLKGLFDGKIGNLVKELAEEISGNLADVLGKDDMSDIRSTKDVINKLMQNPQKIAGLFKTVNDKLQNKMKSGEISHEELLKEATDIMSKMRGSDGDFDFQEMFKNMGEGGNDINNIIKNMSGNLFKNFMGKKEAETTTTYNGNVLQKDPKDSAKAISKASIHEKMKNRILIKKIQQAELQLKEELRISEAAKNFVPYNHNEELFTIDGEEKQSKSSSSEPAKKNKKRKSKK